MTESIVFDLVFNIVVLVFGLDLGLSGFQVLKKDSEAFKKPRLLGLLIMRAAERAQSKQKNRPWIFRTRIMALYIFLAGILLTVGSMIIIFGELIPRLTI